MVDIITWHKEQGGHGNKRLAGHALRLLNETIELCVTAGATHHEILKVADDECAKAVNRDEFGGDPNELPQEFADVSFLQEIFAHYANVDISQAREDKFKILLDRKWRADDDGVLWRP